VDHVTIEFDRGTLRIDGLADSDLPLERALWDDTSGCFRAPAYLHTRLLRALRCRGLAFDDRVFAAPRACDGWTVPELRPYQQDALLSWQQFDRQGVVVLPTGAGKTRVAIAAMACAAAPSVVLCPTRALVWQWHRELSQWYTGPIGVVGDGSYAVEALTVMTFESAWRHLERLGDRFSMVVVDEAHHFGSGNRSESLEMLAAPMRLGLTATAPARVSASAERLEDLLGPTVCELGVGDLVGTWLADYRRDRLFVKLDEQEREEYDACYLPFSEARRDWRERNRDGAWGDFMRELSRSAEGRRLIQDYQRAVSLASFPKAKRSLTTRLLCRHADTRSLVFTALADHAYSISMDNLIPVVTAEIGRAERAEILSQFAEGKLRALASARVLNEGIDVPDATVAIVVAGALGTREHIQRIGRVLRPRPGKRALIYELITEKTLDDERARARWQRKPAGAPAAR
jgi:superfamily II DNA or RNA helicase